jgi:hypothetical protein
MAASAFDNLTDALQKNPTGWAQVSNSPVPNATSTPKSTVITPTAQPRQGGFIGFFKNLGHSINNELNAGHNFLQSHVTPALQSFSRAATNMPDANKVFSSRVSPQLKAKVQAQYQSPMAEGNRAAAQTLGAAAQWGPRTGLSLLKTLDQTVPLGWGAKTQPPVPNSSAPPGGEVGNILFGQEPIRTFKGAVETNAPAIQKSGIPILPGVSTPPVKNPTLAKILAGAGYIANAGLLLAGDKPVEMASKYLPKGVNPDILPGTKEPFPIPTEPAKTPIASDLAGGKVSKTEPTSVYSGANKQPVTQTVKAYDKTLEFPNSQKQVITTLAKQGDPKAAAILKDKNFFTSADNYLKEKYGGQFDALKYNNQDMPQKGVEYHDLKEGKFYSENPATAQAYANQTRGAKYTQQGSEPRMINPPTGETPSKAGLTIKESAAGQKAGVQETATYAAKTHAGTSSDATALVKSDLPQARAISLGHEPLPTGMSSSKLLLALKNHAETTGDGALLKELANSKLASESSLHAQETALMKDGSEDTLGAIKQIQEARIQGKGGAKVSKLSDQQLRTYTEAATQAPKQARITDWNSLVERLACK